MNRAPSRPPFFVYRHYNAAGDLLYVGCTNNPAKRENWRTAEGRATWVADIARTTYTRIDCCRPCALDVERRAIWNGNPIHNIRRYAPRSVSA